MRPCVHLNDVTVPREPRPFAPTGMNVASLGPGALGQKNLNKAAAGSQLTLDTYMMQPRRVEGSNGASAHKDESDWAATGC